MAMGTKENTAVNRLIELAGSKPLDSGGEADDLFAAPKPAPRPAKKPTPPPPFRASAPMPAQRSPEGTPTPELLRAVPEDDDGIPITQEPAGRSTTAVVQPLPRPPVQVEDPWFEPSQAHERLDEDDLFLSTQGVKKRGSGQAIWWVAGAFGLGLTIAALLFWPADARKAAKKSAPPAAAPAPVAAPIAAPAVVAEPAPAEEAIAEPAPAAEAVVEPIAEPIAAPSLVSIRFESRPAGASVVLVEDGQTIPLGAAPVDRTLDPSKRYEVMFSLEGHASVILPVEPSSGGTLWATLAVAGGGAPAVAAPEPVEAKPEPKPEPEPKREAKKERKAEPKPARVAKADRPQSENKSSGKGTLMLAAKPPCDIFIDGKKTGLTTPQRDLDLAAGKHKVTLVNREHRIKESFSVTVKAGQSVRVVKDLTRKMK